MVVSVETTLQHPKRGFIKLEDTVVVTDTGHEVYGDGARGWNRGGTAHGNVAVSREPTKTSSILKEIVNISALSMGCFNASRGSGRWRVFATRLSGPASRRSISSGAHELLRRFVGGVGMILTFHHVRPERPDPFQPNKLLEVTPEFLALVVEILRQADVDLVSLDEMYRRMSERDF